MAVIPEKVVQRLSLYRRILLIQASEIGEYIFSYKLATFANVTPAQVRRDLMYLDFKGNARKGYCVQSVINEIGRILDSTEPVNMALVGIGNLGNAIFAFLKGRKIGLDIQAVFDNDPAKIGQIYQDCLCRDVREIPDVVMRDNITIGIITTPVATAQSVANVLIASGIRGIVNFAPTALKSPLGIFVENVDITMAFEKTAFISRQLN